jgi:hypothetical protein
MDRKRRYFEYDVDDLTSDQEDDLARRIEATIYAYLAEIGHPEAEGYDPAQRDGEPGQ